MTTKIIILSFSLLWFYPTFAHNEPYTNQSAFEPDENDVNHWPGEVSTYLDKSELRNPKCLLEDDIKFLNSHFPKKGKQPADKPKDPKGQFVDQFMAFIDQPRIFDCIPNYFENDNEMASLNDRATRLRLENHTHDGKSFLRVAIMAGLIRQEAGLPKRLLPGLLLRKHDNKMIKHGQYSNPPTLQLSITALPSDALFVLTDHTANKNILCFYSNFNIKCFPDSHRRGKEKLGDPIKTLPTSR